MNFHLVTIFPKALDSYTGESMLLRAQKSKKIKVKTYDPRDFSSDKKHRKVDDKPYGGGPGMVMQAEPILKAVEKAKGKKKAKVVIMSPRGKQFTNTLAKKWAKEKDLILISGHYEGIDARVKKILKAEEVSVGPYTLTNGILPAGIIIDAVSRHIPGVLGKGESIEESRVASGEVYTRPAEIIYPPSRKASARRRSKSYKVPKVLTEGDHKKITEWRKGRS